MWRLNLVITELKKERTEHQHTSIQITLLGWYNMFVCVVALHTLSTDPGTRYLLQVRHWRGRWGGDNVPVQDESDGSSKMTVTEKDDHMSWKQKCTCELFFHKIISHAGQTVGPGLVLVTAVLTHISTQFNIYMFLSNTWAGVTARSSIIWQFRSLLSFYWLQNGGRCDSGFLVWRHLYASRLRLTSEKKVEQPASFWHSGTNPLLLFFTPPFCSSFVISLPSSLLFSSPTMVSCHLVLLMFSTCTSFR